jgi:competence protein ComEC
MAVATLPDNKLHVVFCNVGQGDATLITYKTQQILVDTGPNDRVLDCLSRHMPFYDRTLEAVVVTHLNSDHTGGSRYITDRYSVVQFEPVLRKGQKLVVDKLVLNILAPDSQVLGMNTLGTENDDGIVSEISWNKFKLLLTADVSDKEYESEQGVTIVKIPHHGSKYALDREWLEKIRPKLAVISVGKNSFGHPAPEVIQMLNDLGIKYLRTDKDGEVEIVTDGNTFSFKAGHTVGTQ